MPRLLPASLLALVLPAVFADVQFTSPAAGDVVPVGTIEVQWQDSGSGTSLLDLTQYTLLLMTGGNTNDTMRPISTFVSGGIMSASHNASGTISAGVASDLTNGFFFKIIAASRLGGEVTNYSPRFSIDGLSGYTPPKFRDAAAALDGSTDAPDEAGESPSTSSSATPTLTATRNARPTRSHAPAATPVGDGSPGLTVGIQAGIGVAGAVAGGLLVGIVTWLVLRRRRGQVQEMQPLRKSRVYIDGKAEMSGETLRKHPSTSTTSTSAELSPDTETFEMGGRARPVGEMEAGFGAHETEGSLGASEAEGSAAASEMEGSTAVYELPAQRFSKQGT